MSQFFCGKFWILNTPFDFNIKIYHIIFVFAYFCKYKNLAKYTSDIEVNLVWMTSYLAFFANKLDDIETNALL